ncbi:MAG: PEP-CTERM sorting domain-containing protein [Candidatus Acidiferrales bacterium]
MMKKLTLAVGFLMILGGSAVTTYATPADPGVNFIKDLPSVAIIQDADFTISPLGTMAPPSACTLMQAGYPTAKTLSCSFEGAVSDGGYGVAITKLTLVVGVPSGVSCMAVASSDFHDCSVTTTATTSTITFSDGSIPYLGTFGLQFMGFAADTPFSGSALLSPEPGSLILMLTGGVILLFVGRKLKATGKRQRLTT